MSAQFPPVLRIFAGGLVHAVTPQGVFGAYVIAISAAITGGAAGITYLFTLTLSKRRGPSLSALLTQTVVSLTLPGKGQGRERCYGT